jgi:hypothetical protein
MRKHFSLLFLITIVLGNTYGQRGNRNATPAPPTPPVEKLPVGSRTLNIDSAVTTHWEVTIKGQRIPYDATAGAMPVWDEEGKPVAGVFYTYYERTDIKDKTTRPLVISFNGGPGEHRIFQGREQGHTNFPLLRRE